MRISKVMLLVLCLFISACATRQTYNETGKGQFEGVVEVRWLEPDRFLFVPNRDNPLRFTSADGTRVFEPQPMYTDGGSIPRIFWSIPGYSPWGFGPAYIIHDWLFDAHHCNLQGYEDITFEDSARLMGETIKTLMETDRVPKDEALFANVVGAVGTPIAKRLWDEGNCNLPPPELAYGTLGEFKVRLTQDTERMQSRIQALERAKQETADVVQKQQIEADVADLERELARSQQVSEMTKTQPLDKPATKLLFTIDMGALLE